MPHIQGRILLILFVEGGFPQLLLEICGFLVHPILAPGGFFRDRYIVNLSVDILLKTLVQRIIKMYLKIIRLGKEGQLNRADPQRTKSNDPDKVGH